jgi:hypothetical protein
VNGFLILLVAVWLARDAWRQWRTESDPQDLAVAPGAPTG